MSRSRYRGIPLLAVSTTAALMLTACSSTGTTAAATGSGSGTPVHGGTLTYAVDTEPVSFDIQVNQQDITGAIDRNIVDSLVYQDDKGGFHPWLASSWTVSKDLRTYTFHLRSGVTFTDGTPFDAAAVKTNFDRIVAPATKSQYAASLLGPYAGTKVIDKDTVQVSFTRSYAPFLQAASTPQLGFYSPAAIAAHGSQLGAGGPVDVGTGPFEFAGYTKGQSAVLTRNPNYRWAPATDVNQGPAYLDKLVFRFLPQDSTRVGALQSNQIQVAAAVPPVDVKSLKADSGLQVLTKTAPGAVYSLMLNASIAPFDDERVRQAVQHGINVGTDVQSVYFGLYPRAWSPISPATPDYDSALQNSWQYDPALADKLLDQAGWTTRNAAGYRTKDGKQLTIEWPLMPQQYIREQRDILGQAIQADLKKIGIAVDRPRLDIGTYITKVYGGQEDIADYSWSGADPDVLRLYFNSSSQPAKGGENATFYKDPQLDTWTSQGEATLDPGVRSQVYAQVQQRVTDLALDIPLYVETTIDAASSSVHGLTFDPNTWLVFHDTWLGK
ncbi:ABC transporter substrate-binding protein [Streptacidiphilus sp. PB12-B1b]|uniref:ABC transporter substrate-binding protein n=1 Tax=Streptacidiphilus sp. PB12-B1b TaxID=2705012 RepID=UPI0015FC76CA|nr:ABC transporter substrate-binding protein [Streptacidiphilus sp. PB12-B1b]QMU77011.1 ABC transporter substrate-binding protein [Streptacidiphilus sp. PB12-B1b]